jgi:23S rRNA (guanosine2251-2'-O)-methyltransferase
VLDGITDPGNLGAILRTAECAGVTGVILPRHRSVHISPTVTKTAAGAIEHLPMAVVGGIPTALTRLKELGVFTVGLEAGAETQIFGLPIQADAPVALVLGAEGQGLGRLARERVDTLAAIPLRGNLNSLNVAMAGAVACFEIVRRREEDRAASST